MKLKQPVNWKHTTFLWILRFMLSGVAVSIVFQCLRIIELFQMPEQSLRFIPWEVNNVVTLARLLAESGLFSSRFYAVFDSLLAITNASIYALLLLWGIQAVKEAAKTTPFLTDILKKLKISILLLAGFRFLLVFLEFLLALIYQPPIDWSSLFFDVVRNLFESLIMLGALWCLIHVWMYGAALQHELDETI
ncbi:hypothetical protein CIAN88_11145 [[Clostridium] innocuum]|uniref:DUF2975 domain-containing protein n=2 Tax=Clostridium innocuum TaxID=1522 RepID=A0A099I628_CLOIN|nr:hypothetical protein [[Clostridium] innocuum]KGJ53026.1 hypothetical protein CIAN88_11145 [[Clostridium] innocuum]